MPHADPTSLLTPRVQLARKLLEEKANAKLLKKREDEMRFAMVNERRALIDSCTQRKRAQLIEEKEVQLTNHSARMQSQWNHSQSAVKEARNIADVKQSRVLSNQMRIDQIQQIQAEERLRRKEALADKAQEARIAAIKSKTAQLRQEEEAKQQAVEITRMRLDSFEEQRLQKAQDAIAVKNTIWVQKSSEEAHQRNLDHEERKKRSEEARIRNEHYLRVKHLRDLEHLQAAEDRLKVVVQIREAESNARRQAHDHKAANVKAMAQRVEHQQEELRKRRLEHYEEAVLIGELTRKAQLLR